MNERLGCYSALQASCSQCLLVSSGCPTMTLHCGQLINWTRQQKEASHALVADEL